MRSLETFNFRFSGLFILAFGLALGSAHAADVPDHVPGRLLAVPRRGADAGRMNRTLLLHGARLRQSVPEINLNVLDVAEDSSEAVLQSLRDSGLFDTVERDHYARLAAAAVTPNDPSFGSQWHLTRISAPQAWALNTGASSIVAAIIDSGADGTHPDLAGRLVPGWNFITSTANTTDVVGHGTAVAGSFGAASNNSVGIAGVNWNSKIMPIVVVDPNEFAAYSNIALAIQYAVDHGARVINISIGGTSSSPVLQNAVDYAWSHNVVIFASAMNNSNSTPNYPAACNHAMAVSSTDSSDALSSFSNYGSWITIAAPGSNILTTSMGGGYGYWAGTSFSSPIAAGVASLALSVNPNLTASALVSLIEQNTDDLGTPGLDNYFGWGRVNAYKVVAAAQPVSVASAPQGVSLNAGQTQQFTATVTGSTNTAVTWSINPAVGMIGSTGLYTAPASVATTQTVTVTATAAAGGVATSTITLLPVTVISAPATVSLNGGQTQQFTATVTGTTNTAVTWSATTGTISSTGLYTAPASVSTSQTVTVTATAATGATSSSTVTLVPVSVATAPAGVSLSAGQTQQFTATVTGATNTAVTWFATPGTISSTGLYTAPAIVTATQTVTITATAATGVTATSVVTLAPVGVTSSPSAVSLNAGQTQQFTATVTGATNTTVTWSATAGTISTAGLYSAPASVTATQTVTITATAVTGVTATSIVTLVPVKVTVSPSSVSLNAAQTHQFTATVTGTTNTAVTWSTTAGTISTTGLYTAPASVTATQTVTIIATGAAGATGAATVTLVPVKVTISPSTVNLNAAQTQQFTATVTGTTNTAVTWSATAGAISATGLYTAPASVTATQTVTITAAGATGATASATVTLVPVKVTVSPSAVSLNAAQTQQFTATVTGTTNTAVTWSATAGTISTAGLYTAPASVTATQTVTITATGASGATAAATVTLVPVKVTVSPSSVTLNASQTQQFTATVTGTTNTAVTWTISPFVGTISSSGLYTPPSSVSSNQTITVTATGSTGALATAAIALMGSISISGTFTPIRVNAGGPAYVDSIGQTWSADNSYTGGSTWSTSSAIAGTAAPAVYQSCRYGVFNYAFSAPNGSYTVNLKFSEPSLGGPGQRLFNVSINGSTVLSAFDVYAAAGAMNKPVDRSIPVTVTNGQVNIQFLQGAANWPMVSGIEIVQAQAAPAFNPLRVNAGGAAYTDTLGQAWAADNSYTNGNPWSTASNITGAAAPGVYQTCRWGVFNYAFNVPNGDYTVNLKFAEISMGGPGLRQFNVAINGQPVLTNFDIYAAAGGMNIAVDRPFPVSVANGQVSIQFTQGGANYPLISGIEILTGTGSAAASPTIRVNSSGAAYTDSKGQSWSADTAFTGGNTWSNSGAISGTTDPTLYQSCRWGSFSYGWTVPNGTYTVNLKFAEISRTAAGQRRFNVAINGAPALTDFDIVAAAGAPMKAIDKPFQVTVSNGQITMQFTPGAADQPLVNAIEIVPAVLPDSNGIQSRIDPPRRVTIRRSGN